VFLWQLLFGKVDIFAEERLSNTSMVKMSDREFDDSNAYGSMQDNAAELDTQVANAGGLFFGGIFWMASASLAAIIWKGRYICRGKIVEHISGEDE